MGLTKNPLPGMENPMFYRLNELRGEEKVKGHIKEAGNLYHLLLAGYQPQVLDSHESKVAKAEFLGECPLVQPLSLASILQPGILGDKAQSYETNFIFKRVRCLLFQVVLTGVYDFLLPLA